MSSTRLRRTPWPAWTAVPATALVYALGVPLARILERTGVWPRLLSRGMARMMRDAPPYEPKPKDVLICSYFKTGTNWTMHIALQIAHRGNAQFDHIHDLVPWLEIPPRQRMSVSMHDDGVRRDAPTGLRIIKTHLAFEDITYAPSARYICVVRDPKDVFVSSYHFIRNAILGPTTPSLQSWLDLYLSKDTFCGSWARHLQSGWQNRQRENVLFLTYEEMKADLHNAVMRIAAFMGVDLTREEIDRVVEKSSYGYMKAIGHKFDFIGAPWANPQGSMVRRGERGAAGELLSLTDQRRIDDYWRAELEALGSDFPYDEAFGAQRGAVPEPAFHSASSMRQ